MLLPSFRESIALHVSRLLQVQPSSGALVDKELIDGYGDHQTRVSQMDGGAQANSRFLIRDIAQSFVRRRASVEPIRQLEFIGHADLVRTANGRNVSDEQKVSEARARDVRDEFFKAIVLDPNGQITLGEIRSDIESGEIAVLAVGFGARTPLGVNVAGAFPQNRRVEIRLLRKKSISL